MHTPVLLKEVLYYLDPGPRKFIIDGTVDGGGHTISILKRMMPTGKYLALDLDRALLDRIKEKVEAKFRIPNSRFYILWLCENYAHLVKILDDEKLSMADGLLLDLGVSSLQLESSQRGFSFQRDEPLDMRYDLSGPLSAYEVVNTFSEDELSDIFWKLGEERYARRIARAIIEMRRNKLIRTTARLVEIIKKEVPRSYERGRISPATRVFQALRMYVNKELESLKHLLDNLPLILKRNGRAVIISFHSIEDRMVKEHFRKMRKEGWIEVLTKKPVTATKEEVRRNPRSRSAKLRAIKII